MSGPNAMAPATLTVDLDALAANWRLLRKRAGSAECSAVVKADAYGTGIERSVPALAAAGCRTFFVAHLSEAMRVRRCVPDAVVYVLNGLLPGMTGTYVEHAIRPVVGSFAELDEWVAASSSVSGERPYALHVDTGMNRLGFPPEEFDAIVSDPRLARSPPALLMSHLTSADEPGLAATRRQVTAFDAVRGRLPAIPASLANSSAHFLQPVPAYHLTRPGYALYGGNPVPGRPNPMQPVIRLEARIVQTRNVEPGARVGYGGAWTARAPRRLATLSVGYADGFLRHLSGTDEHAGGAALVAGRLCPFAGRVSMDLIVIDVTEVPESQAVRGSVATLIGDALQVDEVGRRAGTIGYEILTSLGDRYARRYLPAGTE